MGAAQDNQFKLFLCPPMDLVIVFNSDLNGLFLTRICGLSHSLKIVFFFFGKNTIKNS